MATAFRDYYLILIVHIAKVYLHQSPLRQRNDPLGKVSKGVKCTVTGCANDAVRSISSEEVSKAGLKVSSSGRAYLCKNHYREMKKKLKKDREVERWRLMR